MRQLSEERCKWYLKKLRDPTAEEVAEIEVNVGDEVECITFWDNRIMIDRGVLKTVDKSQIYSGSMTMPFKGTNNGIISILHKGYEVYWHIGANRT